MTNKSMWVERDKIIIEFPYSKGLLNCLKDELCDLSYDSNRRVWRMPASDFHAKKAKKFARDYGFQTDYSLTELADNTGTYRKKSFKDYEDKLYPFQKEGINFLIRAKGNAIIADEMGLGKTIETIAYLDLENIDKILVVAPASVLYKWQDEITKWTGWKSQVIRKGKDTLDTTARIHIISYALLSAKVNEFRAYEYNVIVYDECHYLSNQKSQRTRAACFIGAKRGIIGLSGTPFLNRPIEMYTILSLIHPTLFSSRWRFASRYCNLTKTYFGYDMSGATNIAELKEKLQHILLRRTKKELGDQLPELQRTVLMLSADNKTYNKIIKAKGVSKKQRLLQAYHEVGKLKIETAVNLAVDVLQGDNTKVVIYAHHKDVVSGIETGLSQSGFIISTITGSDSPEDRTASIKSFQEDDIHRVMIISEAGGEGINLFRASNIIFAERAWNPGKEEQAEARLHRIGQTNAVTAHYLVAKDTIDEVMNNMIEQKRDVFKSIVLSDTVETTVQDELLKLMEE